MQLCVVSIGVAYKEQVVVGLVYNPVLEDMYTAIRGQGAFCNGVKIKVAEGGISEAVINCGCTYVAATEYFLANFESTHI
jgi:myo-inositol-1(or 4)-monophosphatase